MLKIHILLGKVLFMLADMDILSLVILLLSVAVIWSGRVQTDIVRVCLFLILKYNLIPEFQWNFSECLLSSSSRVNAHLYFLDPWTESALCWFLFCSHVFYTEYKYVHEGWF